MKKQFGGNKNRYSLKRIVMITIISFILGMILLYSIFIPRIWNSLQNNMRSLPSKVDQSEKLLTLFTTVLSANDDPLRQIAQENNLKLLSQLPDTNIVVFTQYKSWIQFARSLGLYVITNIDSNEYGTPYLKSMYQTVMNDFNSYFYGYVNADILFDNTLVDSLLSIKNSIETKKIQSRVFILGQRTNVQHDITLHSIYSLDKNNNEFVMKMLLTGHRYWDSAIDYQIITQDTFDFSEIPNFIIGRAGYDIWLVDYVVKQKNILMIDTTNTVHCVHLLSKEGNRSGIKRNTPDKEYNRILANTNNCQYTHFGYYSDYLLVQYNHQFCLAPHLFQGYFTDTYYEPELQLISKYTTEMRSSHTISCLLITEGDVLGLIEPFCDSLMIIIINPDSCERVQQRFETCHVDVNIGCAKGNISKNQFSVPLFYKITDLFDFIILQSAKPLSLMFWIQNKIKTEGVLIMRHWLESREQQEIQKSLEKTFKLVDILKPPPEFDKTHDPHYGMVVFKHL